MMSMVPTTNCKCQESNKNVRPLTSNLYKTPRNTEIVIFRENVISFRLHMYFVVKIEVVCEV
jgi:hypothetical protein